MQTCKNPHPPTGETDSPHRLTKPPLDPREATEDDLCALMQQLLDYTEELTLMMAHVNGHRWPAAAAPPMPKATLWTPPTLQSPTPQWPSRPQPPDADGSRQAAIRAAARAAANAAAEAARSAQAAAKAARSAQAAAQAAAKAAQNAADAAKATRVTTR